MQWDVARNFYLLARESLGYVWDITDPDVAMCLLSFYGMNILWSSSLDKALESGSYYLTHVSYYLAILKTNFFFSNFKPFQYIQMVDRLQGNEASLIADQVHGESRILELPVESYTSSWSSPELLQYHVTCKGKVVKVYAATAEVQHFIAGATQQLRIRSVNASESESDEEELKRMTPDRYQLEELHRLKRKMKRAFKELLGYTFLTPRFRDCLFLRKHVVKCQMGSFLNDEAKRLKAAVNYAEAFVALPIVMQVIALQQSNEIKAVILESLLAGESWQPLRAIAKEFVTLGVLFPAFTTDLLAYMKNIGMVFP